MFDDSVGKIMLEYLTSKISVHNLRRLAFVFLLSSLCVNCASAQIVTNQEKSENEIVQNADLSTDEAVIAELQKISDEKNASLTKGDEKLAAKRKAASKLEAKDVCIGRLKESAKIIVIGFFRTDVGCRFDGAFVDSRFYERDETDLSKIALAALGWAKANRTGRERLTKIWVGEGLLAFAQMPYQQVSAVTVNDEIKITVSANRPAGVTSRSVPKRFAFDTDGNLLSAGDY